MGPFLLSLSLPRALRVLGRGTFSLGFPLLNKPLITHFCTEQAFLEGHQRGPLLNTSPPLGALESSFLFPPKDVAPSGLPPLLPHLPSESLGCSAGDWTFVRRASANSEQKGGRWGRVLGYIEYPEGFECSDRLPYPPASQPILQSLEGSRTQEWLEPRLAKRFSVVGRAFWAGGPHGQGLAGEPVGS